MCGIAGVFGQSADRHHATIEQMLDDLAHRGPDGRVVSAAESYILGHNRLAINDLSVGGDQPFTSDSPSLSCIYNGEIYNHIALRSRFGFDVPSDCDGAILPALWAKFGVDSLKALRGMYSIAVVDRDAQTLTLAVDPFGIKPCYWVQHEGHVFFASESRALSRSLQRLRPSAPALAAFLLTGCVPANASAYERINRVEPGGWVRFDVDGKVTAGLTSVEATSGGVTGRANLAVPFESSVRAHLLADVPVGLLLSGGVDSLAIAVAASRAGQNLHFVTVDFGSEGEGPAASVAASELKSRHSIVRAEPTAADIDGFFAAMDRPTIDGLNTYLACKAVSALGFKVVLSGTGGDEVLGGGYPHHKLRWLARAGLPPALAKTCAALADGALKIPGFSDKGVSGLMSVGWPTNYESLVSFARTLRHDRETTRNILELRPYPRFSDSGVRVLGGPSSRARLLRAETEQYLMSQLLPDSDSFSMAHSVELRVPFVDVVFANASWGMHVTGHRKASFAHSLASPLVDRAAHRTKQGFGLPMDRWMRSGPLEPYLRRAESRDSAVGGLIDQNSVGRTIQRWRAGQAHWSTAWSLAVADAWMRGQSGHCGAGP